MDQWISLLLKGTLTKTFEGEMEFINREQGGKVKFSRNHRQGNMLSPSSLGDSLTWNAFER